MFNNGYYNKLISILREKVPRNGNLAGILIDLLCLSKESVYRRLRGDVAFTFDEITVLVKHFDISIDEVIRGEDSTEAVFDININQTKSPTESYAGMIERYARTIKQLTEKPGSEYMSASNIVPTEFFSDHENLLKFRLYKQISYESNSNMLKSFSEIKIPDRIVQAQHNLMNSMYEFEDMSLIWDSNIFLSLIKEIEYFFRLKMLTQEDIATLRNELLVLIDQLENCATKGTFPNGNTISIFVSHINFESTYSYMERDGEKLCLLKAYSIGSIDTRNEKLCSIHKNWLLSLKRHSTLISQSGEIERIKFFTMQKEYVAGLGQGI